MTWLEQTIVRILLMVAKMLADLNGSPETAKAIGELAAHVSVHAPQRAKP